jgi:hypothetical protein
MRNGSEPATVGATPPAQETALAGAATPTQETRAIPALTSIFVIRTGGFKFSKPRTDCLEFAIDITTLLSASGTACTWRSSILLRMPDSQEQTHRPCWLSLSYCNIRQVRCARSRAEAAAVRQVGMRTGPKMPRQPTRQPGADLSATGDAELVRDVVVARGGRGRTEVGTGGSKLDHGKRSRQQ